MNVGKKAAPKRSKQATPEAAIEPKDELVRADCDECHGYRKHRILKEHTVEVPDEIGYGYTTFQIVECVGCESVRFRMESMDEEMGYANDGPSVSTFPTTYSRNSRLKRELASLKVVGHIYSETHEALSEGLFILTAGGLRACVEAVCKREQVKGSNLQEKIDGLEKKSLLTKSQADLLHAARYIGNHSLHELEEPDRDHLRLTLDIIESLLETAYIFPEKAKEIEAAYKK